MPMTYTERNFTQNSTLMDRTLLNKHTKFSSKICRRSNHILCVGSFLAAPSTGFLFIPVPVHISMSICMFISKKTIKLYRNKSPSYLVFVMTSDIFVKIILITVESLYSCNEMHDIKDRCSSSIISHAFSVFFL